MRTKVNMVVLEKDNTRLRALAEDCRVTMGYVAERQARQSATHTELWEQLAKDLQGNTEDLHIRLHRTLNAFIS